MLNHLHSIYTARFSTKSLSLSSCTLVLSSHFVSPGVLVLPRVSDCLAVSSRLTIRPTELWTNLQGVSHSLGEVSQAARLVAMVIWGSVNRLCDAELFVLPIVDKAFNGKLLACADRSSDTLTIW